MANKDSEEHVRVFVVDDHELFRHGLKSVLDSEADVEVVGEAGSLAELAALRPGSADVVLLDVVLPDGSGLDAVPALLEADPNLKVVVLTVSDEGEDLYAAVTAGAVGYLLKDLAIDAVSEAVRVAARGESSFSPQMASKLVAGFNEIAAAKTEPRARMTRREREVLSYVAKGWSNRKIADELHLSENTVKNHLRNVCEKLGAHTRTEAVTTAVREGWLTLE